MTTVTAVWMAKVQRIDGLIDALSSLMDEDDPAAYRAWLIETLGGRDAGECGCDGAHVGYRGSVGVDPPRSPGTHCECCAMWADGRATLAGEWPAVGHTCHSAPVT